MIHQLLFLLTVVASLSSTEGQAAYDQLPDDYKKGVDLVQEQLKTHPSIQAQFLFFKSLTKSSTEAGFNANYIRHHFHLKPTRCSKGTANPDLKSCPFRNDRPLIDCVVCYKMFEGKVESDPLPYLNCVQKKALTKEMMAKRVEHIKKMIYSRGSTTLLGRGRSKVVRSKVVWSWEAEGSGEAESHLSS